VSLRLLLTRVLASRSVVLIPTIAWLTMTMLGLYLRVEHAMTFDGPTRGSDYGVYVHGVRWMMEHRETFDFNPQVPYQVRYQPPGWFAFGAIVLYLADSERAIAGLSVVGFLVRQIVLAKLLKDLAPHGWSRCLALSLHAVLPLGVVIDGKVNPESFHATWFTLAMYLLFRMERQAQAGISPATGLLFGGTVGLAILTKGTSSTLLITAIVVFLIRLAWMRREGFRAISQKLLRAGLVAGGTCYLAIGWYCLPNYREFGHPFPHVWDIEGPDQHAELRLPTPYRRSLGWALPFEWKPYLDHPLIVSPWDPRPNFWATVTVGTWADIYNRGFCRLKGRQYTEKAWGAKQGFMSRNRNWKVPLRCVNQAKGITRWGLPLSFAAVWAVVHTAWRAFRSRGAEGSLVVPISAILGALFVGLFALAYPFDNYAVLNPRYLMPISVPMLACWGAWLGSIRNRWVRGIVHLGFAFCIAAVTALLWFMRFGK
jgi:hypothetical protein